VIPTRDPDGDGSRWPALLRHLHRDRAGLFGINARVLAPGRVAVGDHATVAPP
jgi:MOSC domain-containing protein YiiM